MLKKKHFITISPKKSIQISLRHVCKRKIRDICFTKSCYPFKMEASRKIGFPANKTIDIKASRKIGFPVNKTIVINIIEDLGKNTYNNFFVTQSNLKQLKA